MCKIRESVRAMNVKMLDGILCLVQKNKKKLKRFWRTVVLKYINPQSKNSKIIKAVGKQRKVDLYRQVEYFFPVDCARVHSGWVVLEHIQVPQRVRHLGQTPWPRHYRKCSVGCEHPCRTRKSFYLSNTGFDDSYLNHPRTQHRMHLYAGYPIDIRMGKLASVGVIEPM